jgi:hypothetical protein
MENAGIFYGHLEYFTVIWNSLWPFGNVVVIWFIFPRFVRLCQEKSGNPAAVKELTRQSIAFSSVVAAFQPNFPNLSELICFAFEPISFFRASQGKAVATRVARWYFFILKIPIWVNFWRILQRNIMSIWSILKLFGIFYGFLVNFMVIWYIFSFLVCCIKKNMASLVATIKIFRTKRLQKMTKNATDTLAFLYRYYFQ